MKYITTLKDVNESIKKIKSIKKSDTLLIFHDKSETSVPMSLLPLLTEKGCKIEFEEIKSSPKISREAYIAFSIGLLLGKSANDIVNISSELEGLFELFKGTPVKRTRRKSNTAKQATVLENKNDNKATLDKTKNTTDKRTTKTKNKENTKETIVKTKTQTRKKTKEDDVFDKQYEELTKLIYELPKTENFNPVDNMYNIINTVKTSIEQNIPLDKAAKISCSSLIADNLFSAIKGKKKELTDIIKNMSDKI